MFTLIITRHETTRDGVSLNLDERFVARRNRDETVVRHTMILHQQEYKTAKAAWAAATPEFVDSLGVCDNEFVTYNVDVVKTARLAEHLG